MAAPARCLWCNRPGELIELGDEFAPGGPAVFAHPEHEPVLRAFFMDAERSATRVLSGIVVIILAAIVALPVAAAVSAAARNGVAAVAILLVGGLAVRHPLAPPPAVTRLGARTAQRLSRAVGVATVLVGTLLLAASCGL
jgi:hypothetical protein